MRKLRTGTVIVAALALSLPAALDAQGPPRGTERGSERAERRGSERDGDIWDVIRGRGGEREDRGERARRGGPPFCRNGEGHPVHGRQWCRDKGFGLGSRRGNVLEDIVLRTPRKDRRQLDERDLGDVLGDVILGRIQSRGDQIGSRGPLTGEWLTGPRGEDGLRVRAGGLPIAELLDVDGDGAVDMLRLRRER